ncbi:glycosyltransferase [Nocardioides sp. SOB77]|uniref:Glycosyltransferase n=1 Tax=Nocardioides oceani TaxID=3058369 RepID=A0ABT8FJD8_9ACTN|nr:glycosyltransferase [Nocardioides oceani]MDN4174796.1 glycosyltransferase [Nocardioides oceani]
MTPARPETRPGPRLTVVVCAYTLARWDDLVAALDGTVAQTVPPDEVLLVVDHAPELLARARVTWDGTAVTVVENTRARGLSGARNTAIAHATGSVVAFLDDDAVPAPDWLAALVGAYDDAAVLAVGGAARPVWPTGGRPAHLPPELDWVVGCSYRGQPTGRADVRNLMGCSMSFRREVFDLVGGFDEGAGRIGAIPVGCEETELCIRLAQRVPGARVVLEPAAVVHHRVGEQRTSWSYLRGRSLAEGTSKAAMARLVGGVDATATERSYVRHVLTAGVRREVARGLHGDRDGWRAAAGIATALTATGYGYVRGRLGPAPRTMRAARAARTAGAGS